MYEGFEGGGFGNFDGENELNGDVVDYITTDPKVGTYHMEADNASPSGWANCYLDSGTLNHTVLYAACWIQLKTTLPTSGEGIGVLQAEDSSNNDIGAVSFRNAGGSKYIYLYYLQGTSITSTTGSFSFALNTWYHIEYHVEATGPTTADHEVWINESLIASAYNKDSDYRGNIDYFKVGTYYSDVGTHEVYIDEFRASTTRIGMASTETETFGIDTRIMKAAIAETFGVDTRLQKTDTETFGIDMRLKKLGILETFGADARLRKTDTETFAIDSLLRKTFTEEFGIDVRTQLTSTELFNVDAQLKAIGVSEDFAIDTRIQNAASPELFGIDARLKALGVEQTFGIDTRVQLRDIQEQFNIDAVIYKRSTEGFNVDTILYKRGTETFAVDALLKNTFNQQFNIDALVQAIGVTQGFNVDILVMKPNQQNLFAVDVILYQVVESDFAIDARVRATLEQTFGIDMRAKAIGEEQTFAVDTRIQSPALTSTFALDTILAAQFRIVDKDVNPDTVLRTGVNTAELRVDWHDEFDLLATDYLVKFFVREPDDATVHGPYAGSITKEGAREYHATYDWDPQDGDPTGTYDVEAWVYKREQL
jgi:hypothetical protein